MSEIPDIPLEELDDAALEELAAKAMAVQQIRRQQQAAIQVVEQAEADFIDGQEQVSMRYHNAQKSLGLETDEWVPPQPDMPWTRYAKGMSVVHNGQEWYSLVPQNDAEPGTDPSKWSEAEAVEYVEPQPVEVVEDAALDLDPEPQPHPATPTQED